MRILRMLCTLTGEGKFVACPARAQQCLRHTRRRPHCDKGEPLGPATKKANQVTGMAAFPVRMCLDMPSSRAVQNFLQTCEGGAVKKIFGFDFSKRYERRLSPHAGDAVAYGQTLMCVCSSAYDLSSSAKGPASAGLVAPMAMFFNVRGRARVCANLQRYRRLRGRAWAWEPASSRCEMCLQSK